MKKEEIHLWDIKRILFGQAPPEFLLEVFLRSLIVYLIAIYVVRRMGKRMNGQHSIIELAVMVMMGAIIALPIQVPERGILQGVLVLGVTLLLLRGTNLLGFRSERMEKFIQGDLLVLVKDGVLQKDVQSATRITNQQIFEVLRSRQIYNLAKVKRLYLEAYGTFSVYKVENAGPGLPLYPQIDHNLYDEAQSAATGKKACANCGALQPGEAERCAGCGGDFWAKPIL
jgi:uncharacterized membrane protein YcaP (DUF421 family)